MNMQQMMKQARKMQQQLEAAQEEIKNLEVEASAGGGMVKAVVSGSGTLKNLSIDPACVDPEDTELLQDMIIAAITEAQNSAAELSQKHMGSITGGMNIPGLF